MQKEEGKEGMQGSGGEGKVIRGNENGRFLKFRRHVDGQGK